MAYRFLRKDYEALLAKIEELADGVKKAGAEKGMWADQSAETWHDNFGYEEEERRQWTLSERLDWLVDMKNNAEIVDAHATGEIDVGSRVTLQDRDTGEQRSLVVGSYQVLVQEHEHEIAYPAPLARPLLGAIVGEEREVVVGDCRTRYRVMRIE